MTAKTLIAQLLVLAKGGCVEHTTFLEQAFDGELSNLLAYLIEVMAAYADFGRSPVQLQLGRTSPSRQTDTAERQRFKKLPRLTRMDWVCPPSH